MARLGAGGPYRLTERYEALVGDEAERQWLYLARSRLGLSMKDVHNLSWVEEKLLREELYRELEEQSEEGEGTPIAPQYHEASGLPLDPDGSLPFTYEMAD